MKKARKGFAFITAAAMALASLPVLSAGAADAAYALGDVDQDGIITGHDSAMVTRALNVEGASLTEEQQALADVNADGVVDQTDADWIHENEAYMIGDAEGKGSVGYEAAWHALYYYSVTAAGRSVEVIQEEFETAGVHTGSSTFFDISNNQLEAASITQVELNLLDANADGKVDVSDAYNFLSAWGYDCLHMGFYPAEGRYDICSPTARLGLNSAQ